MTSFISRLPKAIRTFVFIADEQKHSDYLIYFYVVLTMHLITDFVNNQLDANSFSYICLFQFSTCFEQSSAHHQQSQLYQYDPWYMSPYVGDRVVRRFTCIPRTVIYTRGRIDTIDSPDDKHMVARNM